MDNANGFCWDIPSDGLVYEPKGTFAFISRKAFKDLKEKGYFIYDGITWRVNQGDRSHDTTDLSTDQGPVPLIHVQADIDRTEMWIKQDEDLPFVLEMRNNPLGIDWNIE